VILIVDASHAISCHTRQNRSYHIMSCNTSSSQVKSSQVILIMHAMSCQQQYSHSPLANLTTIRLTLKHTRTHTPTFLSFSITHTHKHTLSPSHTPPPPLPHTPRTHTHTHSAIIGARGDSSLAYRSGAAHVYKKAASG
jgi:hypothetical protein